MWLQYSTISLAQKKKMKAKQQQQQKKNVDHVLNCALVGEGIIRAIGRIDGKTSSCIFHFVPLKPSTPEIPKSLLCCIFNILLDFFPPRTLSAIDRGQQGCLYSVLLFNGFFCCCCFLGRFLCPRVHLNLPRCHNRVAVFLQAAFVPQEQSLRIVQGGGGGG